MPNEPKEPLSTGVDRSPESIVDGVREVFTERLSADDVVYEPGMEPDPDVEPITQPDPEKLAQDVIEPEAAVPPPDEEVEKKEPADKELSYDEAFAKMKTVTAETEELNQTLRDKISATDKHEQSLNQEMTEKTTMMKKIMDDLGIGSEYSSSLEGRRDVKKATGEMPPGDHVYRDYVSDKILEMVPDKRDRAQLLALKRPVNLMLNMMVKSIQDDVSGRFKGLDERVTGFETMRDTLVSGQERMQKWAGHTESYDKKYGISTEQQILLGRELRNPQIMAMVDTADEVAIETTIRRIVNDPGMAKLLQIKDIPEAPPEKVPEPVLRIAPGPDSELGQSTDVIGTIFRGKDRDGQVR